MRSVVIIQARWGSTRLPGKVLEDLGGVPILAHVINRCRSIVGVDEVCCAISDLASSDPVAELAEACGVTAVRGPEADVLERYRLAATASEAEVIMRITSDCPLIDPDLCNEVLQLRKSSEADYTSNVEPRTWPKGLDCEVFTRAALERAASEATSAYDREHVTPWIRRQKDFHITSLLSPSAEWGRLRWTLDHPEDLLALREIYKHLPPWPATSGYREIMEVLREHPDIGQLNAMHAN